MASHLHNHLLLLFLLSLLSLAAPSRNIPAIIVFGDSTVDPGNNNYILTILKANFPPYGRDFPGGRPTGRFCNGRLATDFISEALGLPSIVPAYLDPAYSIQDFAEGVSFASAGTGLDIATSAELSVIPLFQEVLLFEDYQAKLAAYLGEAEARRITGEAVYIVSVGTNDFVENYFSTGTERSKQFTVEEYGELLVATAEDFVAEIYRRGARKVSFTGLTPFGCLPLERTANFLNGGECVEEYNGVAGEFNAKLQGLVGRLNAALPGLKLRYAPVYDFVLRVVQNPYSYGFENAEVGCCGTGEYELSYLCNKWNPYTCEDADKYAFWDSIHPSERLNRLVANLTLATSLAEFV